MYWKSASEIVYLENLLRRFERSLPIRLVTNVVIINQISDDQPPELDDVYSSLTFVNHFAVWANQQSIGNSCVPFGIKSSQISINVGRAHDQICASGVLGVQGL